MTEGFAPIPGGVNGRVAIDVRSVLFAAPTADNTESEPPKPTLHSDDFLRVSKTLFAPKYFLADSILTHNLFPF